MKVSDHIFTMLDELASQLGVAVERLYPILIKQSYIEGVKSILGGIVATGTAVILAKLLIKIIKKPIAECYGGWEMPQYICVIGLSGLIVMFIFLAYADFSGSITPLLNPEWYVLNDLLKSLVR